MRLKHKEWVGSKLFSSEKEFEEFLESIPKKYATMWSLDKTAASNQK